MQIKDILVNQVLKSGTAAGRQLGSTTRFETTSSSSSAAGAVIASPELVY
jgi:hypothetical protein